MNITWTNMAGFGPVAWNQDGPLVRVSMNHLEAKEKVTHSKPRDLHQPVIYPSETGYKNSG